jgi:hypothetical protein
MAIAESVTPRWRVRQSLTLSLLLWCGLSTGCVETAAFIHNPDFAPSAPDAPNKIEALWVPKVMRMQDTVHGGEQLPGIVGQLYLFGPNVGRPLAGDGSVVVDLFDDTATAHGGDSVLIEEWRIDEKTMKRLLRNEFIGPGYTLYLPWSRFRPDIMHVHMTVCYTPKAGSPLYQVGSPMIMTPGNVPPGVNMAKYMDQKQVQPANYQQEVLSRRPLPTQAMLPPPNTQVTSQSPPESAGATPSSAQPITSLIPPSALSSQVVVVSDGTVPNVPNQATSPGTTPLRVRIGQPRGD